MVVVGWRTTSKGEALLVSYRYHPLSQACMASLPALIRSYTTLDTAEVATSHLPVQVAQGKFFLSTLEVRNLTLPSHLRQASYQRNGDL